MADVLKALNSTAAEAIASDNLFGATVGRPTVFVDPRRAVLGARVSLGRWRTRLVQRGSRVNVTARPSATIVN